MMDSALLSSVRKDRDRTAWVLAELEASYPSLNAEHQNALKGYLECLREGLRLANDLIPDEEIQARAS